MRFFVMITVLIAAVSIIYKWRYKLVNTVLAIGFLRRLVISITMNMPAIRHKLIPNMFKPQTN